MRAETKKRQRPISIKIHFNKQRSAKGLPWTVHTSKVCIPASEVRLLVEATTEFYPEKKNNPRAWIAAKGIVEIEGTVVTVRGSKER